MKKLLLLVLASLFLFSCSGGKDDNKNEIHDDADQDTVMPDSDDNSDTEASDTDTGKDTTDNDVPENDNDPGTEPAESDNDVPENDDDPGTEPAESDDDVPENDDDPDSDTESDDDDDNPVVYDTSKVEWNGKVGTVSFTGDELRTYTLTTNAELRDNYPASKQRTVTETAGSPVLRSGNTMLDALFALAITELNENKVTAIRDYSMNNNAPVDCDCFETGANWHYVWTRDTAYAVHSALAFLEPQKSKNSLEFKVSERKSAVSGGNMQIVQDTGSGGSWPISTDRVVWALGAMETLKNLEGNEYTSFLNKSYEAIKNTLEADRTYVFDEKDGLYRGEQSFLDWREQTYPKWTADNTKHIGMSKTLSTNVLHYTAMKIVSEMAEELGRTTEAAQFTTQAESLKNAIKSGFYLADRKTFSTMKTTFLDDSAVDKMDLLGEALTILSGVADDTQGAEIIAGYPVTGAGPAVIFPQEPDTKIYHNRAIWPFVTSYALRAAAKAGNDKFYENAFMSLVLGAAFNLSNMENFEFTTLSAWYDDATYPQLSGPEVNSRRQLWSVAGFLSMVLDSVFGREQTLKTLWFSPKIPVNLRNTFFAGSSEIILKNLKFKGKTIELKIKLPEKNSETSGFYVLKSLKLDGVEKTAPFSAGDLKAESKIEMELELSNESGTLNLVDCNANPNKCWAPMPVENVSVKLDGKRIGIKFDSSNDAVSYNVYRDGKKIKENLKETSWRDDSEGSSNYEKESFCYSVSAVNMEGWESHHSDPACYWGENDKRAKWEFTASFFDQTPNITDSNSELYHGRPHFGDWGRPDAVLSVSSIKPKQSGRYLVSMEYGNGRPINTGITSCNKIIKIIDENSGSAVLEKMVFMPHLGDSWDRWGESSFVEVDLSSSKTYKAEIRDAFNMSYFKHFELYTGGAGGGTAVYNRANVSTLKFLQKEIKE
ncbi:hypothetical protein J6Z19_09365 [bacterium]|nr:hypothetical protein [bacterium]